MICNGLNLASLTQDTIYGGAAFAMSSIHAHTLINERGDQKVQSDRMKFLRKPGKLGQL